MSTKTARPATDKQISYLLALLEQREVEPSYAFELKIGLEDLDIREASKAIDNLKSYPRRVEVAITQTVAEIDELLTQIEDDGLRSQLTASVEGLRRQLRFGLGLVFER
jgi:hypothetical protein